MSAEDEWRCDCERCHYCGMPVAFSHQHDHFPVPKHAGGTETVPVCANCHDLKDRTPFGNWNPSFAADGLFEVFSRGRLDYQVWNGRLVACLHPLDASGRDRRARAFKDLLIASGDVEARWATLGPAGRLFYAKLRYLVESARASTVRPADRPLDGNGA